MTTHEETAHAFVKGHPFLLNTQLVSQAAGYGNIDALSGSTIATRLNAMFKDSSPFGQIFPFKQSGNVERQCAIHTAIQENSKTQTILNLTTGFESINGGYFSLPDDASNFQYLATQLANSLLPMQSAVLRRLRLVLDKDSLGGLTSPSFQQFDECLDFASDCSIAGTVPIIDLEILPNPGSVDPTPGTETIKQLREVLGFFPLDDSIILGINLGILQESSRRDTILNVDMLVDLLSEFHFASYVTTRVTAGSCSACIGRDALHRLGEKLRKHSVGLIITPEAFDHEHTKSKDEFIKRILLLAKFFHPTLFEEHFINRREETNV